MRAKYGSHWHAHSEVGIRWESQWLFDTFRRRHGEKIRITIVGVLRADSQAALTTAMQTLEAAYDNDYKDFKLYLDDGTTESAHVLLNSDTFGGVKVVAGPNYINGPWSGRPEYANQRTYFIVLQGERRYGTGLYSWKERLVIRGTGAPKWKYSPQMVGDPQAQTLQTSTSFHYIQEGAAIGHDDYPAPPGPLYPGIEHGDERVIIYETPQEQVYGSNPRLPTTQWKYIMEAVVSQGFSAFILPTLDP